MTAASHYLPNLRDVFFNLFEVLGIDRGVLGAGPFASFDADTARASLEGLAEFCTTTWSRSFVEGDQQGVAFDGAGAVTLPKGFTAALEAYYRDGWNKLELPEHLGGYGAPPSVAWAAFELLSGADDLGEYQFHTRTARHFFCRHCGVYPFHRKRVTPDHFGVNVFCLEEFDPQGIPVRATDGKGMA